MNATTARILSLLIGLVLGNIMTAQLICLKKVGNSAATVGTSGNPGMANVMAHLGFKAGITVLIGDVGKALLAMLLSWLFFHDTLGALPILYAGTGSVLGHNYPCLFGLVMKLCTAIRKDSAIDPKDFFKGGKGVATTCATLIIFHPLWGIVSCLIGMIVVFITQYLCVGGVVIPGAFALLGFFLLGNEVGFIGLLLTAMMIWRNRADLLLLPSGQCPKDDVWGGIRRKLGH